MIIRMLTSILVF